MEFRLIPFGNARPAPPPPDEEGEEGEEGEGEDGDAPGGPFVCQHGRAECALNRLYACTMAELGEAAVVDWAAAAAAAAAVPPPPLPPRPPAPARLPPWLDVIACAEEAFPDVMGAFGTCLADKAGASTVAAVSACAAGPKGAALIAAAAAATAALDPPHRYVPWLVVDGLPVGGETGNLAALVCAAYRGVRPAACLAPPPVVWGVGGGGKGAAALPRLDVALGRRGGGVAAAVGAAVGAL